MTISTAQLFKPPEPGRIGIYQLWLYAHLPLVLSLAAAGVGVEHLITSLPDGMLHDRERWLVCGAGALCLLALGLVHFATASAGSAECTYRQAAIRGASAGVLLLLPVFGAGLHPAVLIGVLAAIFADQVVLDLYARQSATRGTPLAAAGQSQEQVMPVPRVGQPGDGVLEH